MRMRSRWRVRHEVRRVRKDAVASPGRGDGRAQASCARRPRRPRAHGAPRLLRRAADSMRGAFAHPTASSSVMSARRPLPAWIDIGVIPVVNVLLAFLVAGLIVLAIGVNPLRAVRFMLPGPPADTPAIRYTLSFP